MKTDQTPTLQTRCLQHGQYRTLVFVSHPSQLGHFEYEPSTLVVSSDWLLVQEASGRGIDCVTIDSCATDGDTKQNNSDIYLRTADWVYDGDTDMTMFRGVSLGRKFSRDFSFLVTEFMRLEKYAASLIAFYKPEQIIFYGCELEIGALDRQGCLTVVQSVASSAGITVVNKGDADEQSTSATRYSVDIIAPPARKSAFRWKNFALTIFGIGLVALSRIQHAVVFWRPTVLMLTSQLTLSPLLNIKNTFSLRPIILFDWLPGKKSIAALLQRLSKGLLVANLYNQELSDEDTEQVRSIESRILAVEHLPSDHPRTTEILRYIHRFIIERGELYKLAKKVRNGEKLLDTWRPNAIFTDSFQNELILILLELARNKGIPCASTWHSFYLIDTKIPVLGGDDRVPPLYDKVFTWGWLHENWLVATESKTDFCRTGNVIANQHSNLRQPREEWHNILVLQYITPFNDIHVTNSNEYEYFIQISKILKNKKFKMRLHPGTSKLEYYQNIRTHFDVDCMFDDRDTFKSCLDWADVVIGPVQSGATLECISYGLPYFPVLLSPNAVNMAYLENIHVFQTFPELEQAFNERKPPDLKSFLESLSASTELPDSVGEVWKQLDDVAN